MSARRGTRLRRKPTPIYQTEDTRVNDEEGKGATEENEQDALLADERSEESR